MTSYRECTQLIHGYLGRGKRIPLPACAYHSIRSKFGVEDDDDDYTGYEDDEDWFQYFIMFVYLSLFICMCSLKYFAICYNSHRGWLHETNNWNSDQHKLKAVHSHYKKLVWKLQVFAWDLQSMTTAHCCWMVLCYDTNVRLKLKKIAIMWESMWLVWHFYDYIASLTLLFQFTHETSQIRWRLFLSSTGLSLYWSHTCNHPLLNSQWKWMEQCNIQYCSSSVIIFICSPWM